MTSPQPNPRRRHLYNLPPTTSAFPLATTCSTANQSLRKSSTFSSPTSPSLPEHDPIVSFPLLPRRSPTCPKDLEDAVAVGEDRIVQLLGAVDRSLSGLESFSSDSQETLRADDLPIPRFMLRTHETRTDPMDVDQRSDTASSETPPPCKPARNHHASDSGIGSSLSSAEQLMAKDLTNINQARAGPTAGPGSIDAFRSICLKDGNVQSGINGVADPNATGFATGNQHALSEYACRQIQKHILLPIIREPSLKRFHPLIHGIPHRVARKEITCLRDLEKVLLWLAPKWSVSQASFLNFCETSIQCLHTTVNHLNDHDQRRPTDRPYTNGYFLDLVEQIRQYAAMLAVSRARMASEIAENGSDRSGYTGLLRCAENNADHPDSEKVRLEGGLSQTGRHAELVRVKDGQSISLRTGEVLQEEGSTATMHGVKRSMSEETDDENDVLRSMARRRKSAQPAVKDVQKCGECDKVFKRPCDLTKHEKTHSRPWKCSDSTCKYHEYGWPTEKERDRHVNDKHSITPSMYRCQYHPCPYESKRESNCKQHMEKAHGWIYVRSKNNGKHGKKPQPQQTPPTPLNATPSSHIFDAPTPDFSETSTSYEQYMAQSGRQSVSGSVGASETSGIFVRNDDTLMSFEDTFGPLPPGVQWNESPSTFTPCHVSGFAGNAHQSSWGPTSAVHATTMPSPFGTELSQHDEEPIFGDNFDWSNSDLDTDFTSYNIQLVTPATSTSTRPLDAFSRNPSISFDRATNGIAQSLSPGAQGDAMLYSPYSSHTTNEIPASEGFGDFTGEAERPTEDFPLFDGSHATSSLTSATHGAMFQDLAELWPATNWSGNGTDLAQQLGIDQMMQVEEEE